MRRMAVEERVAVVVSVVAPRCGTVVVAIVVVVVVPVGVAAFQSVLMSATGRFGTVPDNFPPNEFFFWHWSLHVMTNHLH